MLLRPMHEADVAALADVADAKTVPGWERRVQHLLGTDPAGAWLAERDGRVLGGALALRREGWWILSSLNVLPGADGEDVGRLLMERASTYGAAALRGVICAGPDPREPSLYRAFGHKLYPTMRLSGAVDRTAVPVVHHVRDGTPADVELADAVDRLVRGAAHGPDHLVLALDHVLLVAETPAGRGYSWVGAAGPAVVAATDVATARELLWEVLGRTPAGRDVTVENVTAEQDWAVDVAVRAGLSVHVGSFVCLRGLPRFPMPYVPSTGFG